MIVCFEQVVAGLGLASLATQSVEYKSQNQEWLRLKETSGGHLLQPPCQAETPTAGCSCPCGF